MTKDLKRLQGSWTIISLELDGKHLPSASGQIIIDGEAFTTASMGAEYSGKVVINTKVTPHTIDLEFKTGPEKGNRNLGIFRWEGDEGWTLCLATRGKMRPASFATAAGTGFALETLKRTVEAAGGDAETLGPLVEALEIEGEWTMTACALDGEQLPASMAKYGRRSAAANSLTVTMNGQVLIKARFNVDRSTEPRSIDYQLEQGPSKGRLQKGIYRLIGKTLETIFAAPGAPRPVEFTPGKGNTWSTWKKA